MLLNELLGYKKAATMTFAEWVYDVLSKDGVQIGDGWFSYVIIPESKNYIYKVWVNDEGYEEYIKLAKKHQDNPAFPKFLSDVKTVPFPFKRSAEVDSVRVVKMEKLAPSEKTHRLLNMVDGWFRLDPNHVEEVLALRDQNVQKQRVGMDRLIKRTQSDLRQLMTDKAKGRISIERFNDSYMRVNRERLYWLATQMKIPVPDMNFMIALAHIAKELRTNPKGLSRDLHSGNVMWRGDQPVIIDPWVKSGATDDPVIRATKLSSLSHNDNIVKVGRAKSGKTDAAE